MGYKHGTYQTETSSDISLPIVLDYGHFIVGTAPMNKVKRENRRVNEIVRLGTYKEAIQYFGDTYDLDFSISQAIKVFFELYKVAPLYVVNILDLEKHKTVKKTQNDLSLTNGKAVIPNHKLITDTLVVKENATSQVISDAVTMWTDEGLEIYAKPSNGTKIDIEYEEIDLSKVTKAQALGGYDILTMKRAGLELLDEVFLKYSELPAFIDIPDFSSDSEVAAIMQTKAKNINGNMFEAVALINAPIDKPYDHIQSIQYAALSLSVDNENGGVPSQTPSNYLYKCDSLYWKNSSGNLEDIILDKEQQANLLNKNGVVTAINFKGWKCWGSETALNPMATDPKDKFIYTRRMFKYIGNELVISYFDKVDKKFSKKLAETVTKSMNIRLNAIVARNDLLSANATLSAEDNDTINVTNGDITWVIKLGVIPGMKSATFKKKYDADALTEFANSLGK